MISGLSALAVASALGGLVYWIQRRRGSLRARWILGAVALPFVAVAYIWGIFVLYGIHCEAVRDVDLGIGDTWRVPLAHGYKLTMIDMPEQAFVSASGDKQLHHGLSRIGATEHFVAVEHGGQFFLIDVRSGNESALPTEPDVQAALHRLSESEVELMPPAEYYHEHRWGTADALAAAIAFAPPGLTFLVFTWRFARTISQPKGSDT